MERSEDIQISKPDILKIALFVGFGLFLVASYQLGVKVGYDKSMANSLKYMGSMCICKDLDKFQSGEPVEIKLVDTFYINKEEKLLSVITNTRKVGKDYVYLDPGLALNLSGSVVKK